MRYLGIDYGHRKVGLAISDEAGSFAFPYQVIQNFSREKLLREIKDICEKEGVGKIVMGESLDLSGEANLIQSDILIFKENLEKETGLEIIFEREFFTTWEAKRIVDEDQNDKQTDARAAALILKSFLDKKSR
ncbi:MAG: Holliday junction resolvase RuvX [Candidatus Paceibacterota bacterium]|jgi:putative Holliday junction resolvase